MNWTNSLNRHLTSPKSQSREVSERAPRLLGMALGTWVRWRWVKPARSAAKRPEAL